MYTRGLSVLKNLTKLFIKCGKWLATDLSHDKA